MHDAPLRIGLAQPAYVGIVIMRPRGEEQRGVLLLNVAETEARIKFLPGYLSVSFFTDREGGIVAEYVRWESEKDAGAAFARPEFFEHLPIVHDMTDHSTVAFGTPVAIQSADASSEFDFGADNYAMTILRCDVEAVEATRVALTQWYGALLGEKIRAIAIHVDAKAAQFGVLVAGSLADIPAPGLDTPGTVIVEHIGALRLYTSVTAGGDPAQALHYSMAAQS